MTVSFGTRLRAALDARGPLCVGIDPHAELLEAWGLSHDADGVREFGLRVIDAAASRVGVVKPQVAFFECFGSRGFSALEDVLSAARDAELLTVADAKRGDIGSTMTGYAEAWLRPGAPLEADALTVSPYLGPESLRQTLTDAEKAGKGLFVLAATSNPEGAGLQRARIADDTVARHVVDTITIAAGDGAALRSAGVVIGATVERENYGLTDEALSGVPVLAPGFGAQGARPEELRVRFGGLAQNLLANESRSVLSAGPDRLAAVIAERAERYREALHG